MSNRSTVGVVMLVHEALDRAAQVARHWAANGCPVVVHVDLQVSDDDFADFTNGLSDLPDIVFSARHHCEWGAWSLVQASQTAAELMLRTYPDVRHVYLASGSCLPLRPIRELVDYLDQRPRTDFIESTTTQDVPWATGGLNSERFTLLFPFSWKRHRRLFDRFVRLQRRVGYRRKMPDGLIPHLGSQWWCLTRQTLSAILEDPARKTYENYFKWVWIPDESYYQTLVRLYSTNIESRSLTLAKFDYQGKPHTFYNDHLQLLRRSDCFVARKIWPNADRLYQAFLNPDAGNLKHTEPNPGKIDRVFSKAVERRTHGRAGLYMQSRYPVEGRENGMTASGYTVLQGFDELLVDFAPWLEKNAGVIVHGHLFAPERAEFSGGGEIYRGGVPDSALIRDYSPKSFLTNMIWNARGEHQCFQYGPNDTQALNWFMAKDPNAHIYIITGAWVVPLFHSNLNFSDIRKEAARLQRIERDQLNVLRSPYVKARVHTLSMSEFVESPMEVLQTILDTIGPRNMHALSEIPKLVELTGFGKFLQNLKNQGMHPYLMGEFPVDTPGVQTPPKPRKPYLVRK